MRFDDRLSTVLGLSAEAPRDRAVQWRQLVELVARGGGSSDPALLAKALERIAALRPEVPDAVRASAARAVAGPAIPTGLLAIFAADRPEIAAPLLASADLDAAGWAEVRAGASAEVRALIDSISPPPDARQERRAVTPTPAATPVPEHPTTHTGVFRWECGPSGEVDWVEGAPRAAVVGLSLAREISRPFNDKLPFQDEALVTSDAGEMAGAWLWSGLPRFDPSSGRFAGYAGLARREGATLGQGGSVTSSAASPAPIDSAALRELIHELRTPLTAIIGFGEIIEGQFLGPAHRAYRDRAGEIVRQARRLLGAVEELDLAAKLSSANDRIGAGAAVVPLINTIQQKLSATLIARGASIDLDLRVKGERFALEEAAAERLVSQFSEAVSVATESGDRLTMVVERSGPDISISMSLPKTFEGLSEERLFEPALSASSDGGVDLGFALRITRSLAAIAGGGLTLQRDCLVLHLPSARPSAA